MPRIYICDDDLTFHEVTPADKMHWKLGYDITQEQLNLLNDLKTGIEFEKDKLKEAISQIIMKA